MDLNIIVLTSFYPERETDKISPYDSSAHKERPIVIQTLCAEYAQLFR